MSKVVMTFEEVRDMCSRKVQNGEWNDSDTEIFNWYQLVVFIMNKSLLPYFHHVTEEDIEEVTFICNQFVIDAYNYSLDTAMFCFAETFEGGFGEGRKFHFTPELSAEWRAIRESILN